MFPPVTVLVPRVAAATAGEGRVSRILSIPRQYDPRWKHLQGGRHRADAGADEDGVARVEADVVTEGKELVG